MVKISPGAADPAAEEELILSGSEESALTAPEAEAAPVSGAAAVRENMARLRKIGHVPWKKDFKTNWVIYCLFIPVLVWLILFHYLPIGFSIPLAFKDYKDYLGIFNSPWNGWENFKYLFTGGGVGGSEFLLALRNTFAIGGLNLTIGFIVPVLFALLVSQLRFKKYKRVCQMLSYLPNFVASVVIVQIMQNLLDRDGALTMMFHNLFGAPNTNWLADDTPAFWGWYILFSVWQGFGYGSITYVSAISNISEDLYEAAAIDGANRWQMMWKITLPGIMPLILMLWLLQIGVVFKVGFDRTFLLYNASTNADVCDTLFSYTMRMTLNGNLGIATVSSLFQSIVGTVLMLFGNWISRKSAGVSMF